MRSLKNIIGILGALIGILYCGGLIFYFVGGWGELGMVKALLGTESGLAGAKALGLGPTILGLGIIGSIFVVVLLVRIVLLVLRRDPPPGERSGPSSKAIPDEKSGAAADAMIARYMAKHPAAAPAPSQQPTPHPTVHRALPPQRPSFGRRIR